MGYVHDTSMSYFVASPSCHFVGGTWTDSAGAVAGTLVKTRAAADATFIISVPVCLPGNSKAFKGSFIKTIDVIWAVTVAALDSISAVIYKQTLPVDGAAFGAASSQAFTYDTGHDTANERLTLDEHHMVLTLTTPFWIDDNDLITIQINGDAAATSVMNFNGARINYTLRV
jgi:hypothetical protein